MASGLVRTNAVTVGDVLDGHTLLERRGEAFRRAVASLAEASDIPVLSFAGKRDKGRPGVLAGSPWPERKIGQVMPLMRKVAATGRSQVVAIGVAQEYQVYRKISSSFGYLSREYFASLADLI